MILGQRLTQPMHGSFADIEDHVAMRRPEAAFGSARAVEYGCVMVPQA